MRRIIVLLQLLLSGIVGLSAQQNNESLSSLYTLAGKSFNYSSPIPEEQILQLCQQQETIARAQNDYEDLFVIQQITVNSYCLKGDIGLAVNKAQLMYEEAKRLKSDAGLVLSIQAIGDTYLHSNQHKQAYLTFTEAVAQLNKLSRPILKIRLLMQQLHACMLIGDLEKMNIHLIEVRKLLDRIDTAQRKDYAFHLQYYQTSYNIAILDKEQAFVSLNDVRRMRPQDHTFDRLYYQLSAHYYELTQEYSKALAYCDSTLAAIIESRNLNEYRYAMMEKAVLLGLNGNKKEACYLYDEANNLADSLNIIRYSEQIDSLHISYWVDQMAFDNMSTHNRFLRWSLLGVAILLLTGLSLFFIARKKNKQLVASRRRLEATRKESESSIQSKSLFLSNMSHELRTPLNAIVGFADLLATEIVTDAESKQQFGDRIKQNADLLLRLFNDVADLSALKDKNIRFTYESCEAVSLCRNVVDTVENVKQTAATLHFSTNLNKLALYTDSGRLQQVLINLLINATKFTPTGSITLILEVDEAQSEAKFIIEDTGCGIPLEKQPHIFERFEKLHEGIQGAGLGLSICQLIVEHVGGNIWIDADYTLGARFIFTHPLKQTNKSL